MKKYHDRAKAFWAVTYYNNSAYVTLVANFRSIGLGIRIDYGYIGVDLLFFSFSVGR